MTRAYAQPTAFWNNVAVSANGVSPHVRFPGQNSQLILAITTSAPTIVRVEAALNPPDAADNMRQTFDPNTAVWAQVFYLNDPIQIEFTQAGSAAVIIPSMTFQHIRLRSTKTATITAGFETAPG